MFKDIVSKIKQEIVFAIAFGVAFLFAGYSIVNAIVVTAPPRAILPGDITSTSILDYTITGVDVSTTTIMEVGKMNVGTTSDAGLLHVASDTESLQDLVDVSNVASTSLFKIRNDGKIGVGSSTPSETVSINGSLAVTGTTTLNNVPLKWPATAGSSGQFLRTDGINQLSWGLAGGNWQALLDYTATTTYNEFGFSFPAKRSIWIQIYASSSNIVSDCDAYFNHDNYSNYTAGWRYGSGSPGAGHSGVSIGFYKATTSPTTIDMFINNIIDGPKTFWGRFIIIGTGTTMPDDLEIYGKYRKGGVQINHFKIDCPPDENFDVGSRFTVYGSEN